MFAPPIENDDTYLNHHPYSLIHLRSYPKSPLHNPHAKCRRNHTPVCSFELITPLIELSPYPKNQTYQSKQETLPTVAVVTIITSLLPSIRVMVTNILPHYSFHTSPPVSRAPLFVSAARYTPYSYEFSRRSFHNVHADSEMNITGS